MVGFWGVLLLVITPGALCQSQSNWARSSASGDSVSSAAKSSIGDVGVAHGNRESAIVSPRGSIQKVTAAFARDGSGANTDDSLGGARQSTQAARSKMVRTGSKTGMSIEALEQQPAELADLASNVSEGSCDAEWTPAEGACYKFVLTRGWGVSGVPHSEAEAACAAMKTGAHLATIQTAAQNQAVAGLAGSYSEVAIGLYFDGVSSSLAWKSGDTVGYEAEYYQQPESDGDCARIVGSAHSWHPSAWHKWPCSKVLRDGYVCSYSNTLGHTLAPTLAPTPAPTDAPTPTPTPAPTQPAVAVQTCSSLLTTASVWGRISKGLDLHAVTNYGLLWLGCCGDGCHAGDFFCNDAGDSMSFGSNRRSAVRVVLGNPTSLTSIPSSHSGCSASNKPQSVTNSPDHAASFTKLCNQLGYSTGSIDVKISSNSCPEATWEGNHWWSDFVNSAGYGQKYTCSGKMNR